MKYILNISIYLSFLKVIKTLHPMISMWSVFYTYTVLTLAMTLGNGSGTHSGASQCIPMGPCHLTRRLPLGVFIPLEQNKFTKKSWNPRP